MSPSGPINKNKSPGIINRLTKDSNEPMIKQGKYSNQNNFQVKFSSMFSQKIKS